MVKWLDHAEWTSLALSDDDDLGLSVYCPVSISLPKDTSKEAWFEFGMRPRRDGSGKFDWYLSEWKYQTDRKHVPNIGTAEAGDDGWLLIEQLRDLCRDPIARANFFARMPNVAFEEWANAGMLEFIL